jgi:hypothetical protein
MIPLIEYDGYDINKLPANGFLEIFNILLQIIYHLHATLHYHWLVTHNSPEWQ